MLNRCAIVTTLAMAAAACTGGADVAPVTGASIIDAFEAAGLDAASPTTMQAEHYGMAPYVCNDDATRFTISVVGEDAASARLYVCDSAADADKLADFYARLGEASAILHSHLYRAGDGRVLLQMAGTVPAATAVRYEAVLLEVVP